MKKLFLITSLVVALTFGVVGGTIAGPKNGHTHETVVARVSITDVMCPCGCPDKAIDCLCESAIKALNDAGFSVEDIEKHFKNNQTI